MQMHICHPTVQHSRLSIRILNVCLEWHAECMQAIDIGCAVHMWPSVGVVGVADYSSWYLSDWTMQIAC